jgi:hypothetical protein
MSLSLLLFAGAANWIRPRRRQTNWRGHLECSGNNFFALALARSSPAVFFPLYPAGRPAPLGDDTRAPVYAAAPEGLPRIPIKFMQHLSLATACAPIPAAPPAARLSPEPAPHLRPLAASKGRRPKPWRVRRLPVGGRPAGWPSAILSPRKLPARRHTQKRRHPTFCKASHCLGRAAIAANGHDDDQQWLLLLSRAVRPACQPRPFMRSHRYRAARADSRQQIIGRDS